jgi:hypothetical protein
MKRSIVALLFISLCWFSKAQCTLPYKTLAQFRNDTTAFINYNFSDRADCYAGKPLSNGLTDLGIPVKSFDNTIFWYKTDIYKGMYIFIYTYRTQCIREDNKNYTNTIHIEWDTPLAVTDIDPLADATEPEKWTARIENAVKARIIKKVGVVRSDSSTSTPTNTTTPATRTPAASQTTGPVDAASRRATTTSTR